MKFLSPAIFVLLPAFSFCSFDLVLVADGVGGTGGPTISRVHRFDGNTGVYLGAFGNGIVPYTQIEASHETGSAYLLFGNRVQVWNYSTGEYLIDYATPGLNSMKYFNGQLYWTTSNSINRLNLTTGANTLLATVGGASLTDIAVTSTGAYSVVDILNHSIRGYSNTGALGSVLAIGVSVGADARLGAMGASSTGISLLFGSAGSPTVAQYNNFNLSSAGVLTTSASGTFISSYLNTPTDVASAHDGIYYFAHNDAGGSAVYRRNNALQSNGYFTVSQAVSAPGTFATVLAPEPGSLAAAAFGAIGLFVRRRRR